MVNKIKFLMSKTGCGLLQCGLALKFCDGDIRVAYEYLKLKSQPVVRYKIIEGRKIEWTEKDYVEEAKHRIKGLQL